MVLMGLAWFLKSIKLSMLSLERRQYFRFYSDAVYKWLPVKFQEKDIKSDLFFFSNLADFKGDYLTSQNLKDSLERVPKTLLVPNLTTSTLLS